MIRAQDQGGEIPGLIYRGPAGVGGGYNHHLIGTIANNRASLSFVTGSQNMKFGYQGGFNNPSQTYTYFTEINFVRLRDGVPNQLATGHRRRRLGRAHQDRAQPGPDVFLRAGSVDPRSPHACRAALRYDWYLTNYPDQTIGGPGYTAAAATQIFYPSRSTQGASLEGHHAAHRRCLRPLRQRQDGDQVQPRASTWKPFRRPTATWT